MREFTDTLLREHGRLPLYGTFEITARCNLACRHCYMCDYRDEEELDLSEIFRILDEIAAAGCLNLLITGGDPLCREDFPAIWRRAKGLGFVLTLFTNATLIDEPVIGLLRELPPAMCEVSVYGSCEETYTKIARRSGMYARAVRGIRMLREAVPNLALKSTLLRDNAHEMDELGEFARSIGCDFYYDAELFPRLDRTADNLAAGFGPEEGVMLTAAEPLHRKEWSDAAEAGRPERERIEHVVVCRGGVGNFHIGPYGDLCLCALLREPHASLRETSFTAGWEDVLGEIRSQKRCGARVCETCEYLADCLPCAGRNHLENCDIEKPGEWGCRRARAIHELRKNYEKLSRSGQTVKTTVY